MSTTVTTVSYEDFSTSNQATVGAGGPWIVQSATNFTSCSSENSAWCGGYCLGCRVEPLNAPPAYQGSFVTNISVNLTEYGGATSLDFTWDYWPVYCGSNTTVGSGVPLRSQVGIATFEEEFLAVNYTTFIEGRQWDNASKISHNGSTPLVRGSDPNLGYIALKINVIMGYSAEDHEENLDFYVKGIKFLITTPIQSAGASSPSATSTQQVDGPPEPLSSSTTRAEVVAEAVIGTLAFVSLFILAVCLFRRRHKKGGNPVDDTTIHTEQINHESPIRLEGAVLPPHLSMRYRSTRQASFDSIRPASFVADGSYGPPPIYAPDDFTGQDRPLLTPSSPELARFAAANREAINENLEARLQAAGYLPTEDPSRLTTDEWRNEYRVTKLELRRLKNLCERTQQGQ